MFNERRIPICFDFDGVIHSFVSGWMADDVIADLPMEGARESLEWFRDNGFYVMVHSCRSRSAEGITAMRRYLEHHRLPFNEVCADKPTAVFYVDDHGFKFHSWEQTITFMTEFLSRRKHGEATKC